MPSATASYSVWRAFSAPVGSWKIICAWRRCSRSPRRLYASGSPRKRTSPAFGRMEAHDRAGERRLAAAGLAHERERLALVHGEVHPVHRARRAVAPGVVHVQAAAPPASGAPRRHVRHRRAWRRARTPPRAWPRPATARRGCAGRRRSPPGSADGTGSRSADDAGRAGRREGRTGACGTPGRRSRGTRRRARACTGAPPSAKTLSFGPSSTIRPAYITAIRLQMSASVERSCVMKMIARPSSR